MRGKVKEKNKLTKVHTHLFDADVVTLKQLAESIGSKWQIELRQLVRRALVDEREVMKLKEQR